MTYFCPPPSVLGDLRPWDQAAGGRLRLPEPNRNRRGALQPSSQAEDGKGLSSARMPQLEGQQVEGGTYRLRSEQLESRTHASRGLRMWDMYTQSTCPISTGFSPA